VLEAAASGPPDQILPPRYLRIDELLGEEEHARLLAYALSREADFAASSVIDTAGVFTVDEQFRRSATLHELEEIWDLFEAPLRRLLPLVRRELGIPWFRLGQIERQMAAHRQGDFFNRHNDSGDALVADRRVTCVYYFHGQPKRFSGGDLKLYDQLVRGGRVEAGTGHVVVVPEDNTAVFFASSTPHEVCPVSQDSADFAASRFSITVWFRIGAPPRCLEDLAGQADAAAG
jgi:predicted 2-oxoglutarate/Fe(II)-dependent dioxygenase YbiX